MKKILANKVYSDSTLKKWTKEQLIEQIRILEHNWACAEESLANSVKNSDKIFYEQKAEIERLNDMKFTQEHCDLYKENEWLKAEIKRELAEHEEFTKKAKVEIERLTEEKKTAWRKFKQKVDESIELSMLLDKRAGEKAELQKQVDEWKTECQELHDECEGCFAKAKDIQEQTVKDTAKEILQKVACEYTEDFGYTDWLEDCYFGGAMERLCDKYGLKVNLTENGVEVE